MTIITLAVENGGGAVAANQHQSILYGLNMGDGRYAEVLIDSCAAPTWSGDELDEEERFYVLTELDREPSYAVGHAKYEGLDAARDAARDASDGGERVVIRDEAGQPVEAWENGELS